MAAIASFNNRLVQAGTTETPSVPVPPQYSRAALRMSRNNWPATPVEITLWLSYDNEQTWRVANRAPIGPGEITPKYTTISDAVITMGWSSPKPTHAKASVTSPSSFRSDISIEAD